MLKLDQDQRAGIINAIERVANKKAAPQIVALLETAEQLSDLTITGLIEAGISATASENVIAAIELHTVLANVQVRKQREKKPSVAERYSADTSSDEQRDMAIQVAELRINATGSKPLAWRTIRERLGLKNEQFHKVIRISQIWREVVIARIHNLKAQEGGWEYNGKLEVLTGIEISEEEINAYVSRDAEVNQKARQREAAYLTG